MLTEILDSAILLVGSENTEEIETLTQLLVDCKVSASELEQENAKLKEDLAMAQEKNIALRESNSKIFRQLTLQEEKNKNAVQVLTTEEKIANIF